jgi:hypothetical protein
MEAMSAALQKAETRASQASKSTEALEYQLSEVCPLFVIRSRVVDTRIDLMRIRIHPFF